MGYVIKYIVSHAQFQNRKEPEKTTKACCEVSADPYVPVFAFRGPIQYLKGKIPPGYENA
jgi:hypothetical protein